MTPKSVPHIIKDDPDDDHILACALAGRADLIVSGDRHLLKLKSYKGIGIVRPKDFLHTLEGFPGSCLGEIAVPSQWGIFYLLVLRIRILILFLSLTRCLGKLYKFLL